MSGILLILTSGVTTAVLFLLARSGAGGSGWTTAAQLAGTFSLLGLSWSYILSVRQPYLEELFGGLDKVYKIHQWVGAISFVLAVNHPLWLMLSAMPANTLKIYLLPSASLPYSLGVGALYTLAALLVLTLFVDLPYRLWKKTHEWMGVVIVLAGAHAYLVPSALTENRLFEGWMLTWAGAAILSYMYKRFWYYRLSRQSKYRVESVEQEKETVVLRLHLNERSRQISFEPGQYAFFALSEGESREEHPFSVLAQSKERLVIALKTVGGFTLKLAQLKPGTEILVRGPYGTFSQATGKAREMVWIAGGIGVTPFATMAGKIRPEQQVTMYYTTSDGGPTVIREAFRRQSELVPNFQFVEHLTTRAGRLTAEVLQQAGKVGRETYYFLCGPQTMMASLTEQLTRRGVRRKRIIYEDFSLK
jgi:predicted ferric reductase